jgi:hypothetical protein
MTIANLAGDLDSSHLGKNPERGRDPVDAEDILSPELWPVPNWLDSKVSIGIRGYKEYFTDHLRIRFAELEVEFRSVYGNFRYSREMDHVTAARVADLLHRSRQALEGAAPDLLVVTNLLDQVERYMVWLYPPHISDALITRIRSRVESLPEPERSWYREQVATLTDTTTDRVRDIGRQRSIYGEVTYAFNRHVLFSQISGGLQIERLKALLFWGGIFLVAFLAAFPLLVPASPLASGQAGPQVLASSSWATAAGAWLSGLSVALIGAIGAFLSGLLQVRRSRITLPEYEESMRKLELRPLVGASFALVLYLFLAWRVLAGVEITNLGSYFFVAFLSGFSERYFLRLMDLKADDGVAEEDARATDKSTAPGQGGGRGSSNPSDENGTT